MKAPVFTALPLNPGRQGLTQELTTKWGINARNYVQTETTMVISDTCTQGESARGGSLSAVF